MPLQALTFFHLPCILQIKEVLPANEQFPYKVIKEVTAIFVRDGRLLLFAVTDLNNEADHTDHENTKLEQFRECNHNHWPPFLCVGGHKKTFYPPQMQWEAARLPFIGSTIVSIPYFVAKSNPASNRKRGFI